MPIYSPKTFNPKKRKNRRTALLIAFVSTLVVLTIWGGNKKESKNRALPGASATTMPLSPHTGGNDARLSPEIAKTIDGYFKRLQLSDFDLKNRSHRYCFTDISQIANVNMYPTLSRLNPSDLRDKKILNTLKIRNILRNDEERKTMCFRAKINVVQRTMPLIGSSSYETDVTLEFVLCHKANQEPRWLVFRLDGRENPPLRQVTALQHYVAPFLNVSDPSAQKIEKNNAQKSLKTTAPAKKTRKGKGKKKKTNKPRRQPSNPSSQGKKLIHISHG